MKYKDLSTYYFPAFDRFMVSSKAKPICAGELQVSEYYTGYEYFRYIPDLNLTKEQMDDFLCIQPQELCCEITTDCNLKCPICIANALHDRKEYLSTSSLTSFLERLAHVPKRITLTGGEPTLHPDFIEFVNCVSRTSSLVISSNGLQPVLLYQALEIADNSVLQISLHGDEKQHDAFVGKSGAFQAALESIKICSKKAAKIEILTIAIPSVICSLSQLLISIIDLPVSEVRINLVKQGGRQELPGVIWEDVLTEVKKCEFKTKLSVKRISQPFIFMNVLGEVQQRYGRTTSNF